MLQEVKAYALYTFSSQNEYACCRLASAEAENELLTAIPILVSVMDDNHIIPGQDWLEERARLIERSQLQVALHFDSAFTLLSWQVSRRINNNILSNKLPVMISRLS